MQTTLQRGIAMLLTLVVLSSSTVAPAAALEDSQSTADVVDWETGDGLQPTVIVEYNNLDSLEAWAEESSSRRIVETNSDRNTSVVAGPTWATQSLGWLETMQQISAGGPAVLTSTPLAEKSYIESVSINYQVSIVEPVDALTSESNFEPPTDAFAWGTPEYPTDGVAFDDVDTTTIGDARRTLGADNISATGSGQDIAVIDTGANVNNGNVFGNGTAGSEIRILNASKNMITGETVESDGWSAISDGSDSLHGTWTASAIAANASGTEYDGIARDSELLVLKALGDDGSGSTSDIAESIRYAADQNVDVISASLGSPISNPQLRDAIDYAYEQGVDAVVVAVGNSRATRGANIGSPADYGATIAVASTTTNDSAANVSSSYFSQPGPDPGTADDSGLATAGAMPDVGAPGHAIEAQVPDVDGYLRARQLSGTSMATPQVAAGLAAALEANSTLASADHETIHSATLDAARNAPSIASNEIGDGVFAVDNLIDGTEPETSQVDAMSSSALTRDEFWSAHSDAQGGWFAGLLGAVGA